MIAEVRENYTLLTDSLSDFSQMLEAFSVEYSNHSSSNIILELSENLNMTSEDFSLFLDYSEQSKANGTSFVVVKKGIAIDNLEEMINIVPTLQEAKDIIEMEAIERDLGF